MLEKIYVDILRKNDGLYCSFLAGRVAQRFCLSYMDSPQQIQLLHRNVQQRKIQKYDQRTYLLTWVGAGDTCVSKNTTGKSANDDDDDDAQQIVRRVMMICIV